jgi:two-component system NtrC family sensor kinase
MAVDPVVDEVARARTDLLLSRMSYILFFGAVVYPLFFILDWHERPWDRIAALVVRLVVTLVILVLARLSRSAWGRPRALLLGSIGFLVAQAGFAVIIWHARGFGSSNGDAFELFFGPYCMLVPATTGWAAVEGAAMLGIQLVTYAVSGGPVDYGGVAWNAMPFFVIFLSGRHVANLVEIAWRREFVGRATLEDAFKQLQAIQDKLVQSEKMAALGRLTAGVAHELKNPLFVIGTNLSVIQDLVDELTGTSATTSTLQKLADGVHRLRSALGRASMVSDLLRQFSSPPQRRDAPTNVNALVEMSISLVDMKSRRKEIAIHRNFDDLPPLDCDSQSLSQVFVNLIENACDAVSEGGNIWVATKTKPAGLIIVSVSDDGTGIPAQYLDRVTEPFFTTKEPGRGMGLGLAVATSIVERYGGELTFSARNPGTIAVVTLPLKLQASSNN